MVIRCTDRQIDNIEFSDGRLTGGLAVWTAQA